MNSKLSKFWISSRVSSFLRSILLPTSPFLSLYFHYVMGTGFVRSFRFIPFIFLLSSVLRFLFLNSSPHFLFFIYCASLSFICLPFSRFAFTGCDLCIARKRPRPVIPRASNIQARSMSDIIHSYVHGPLQVPSKGKSRYIVRFIEKFSHFAVVCPKKQESKSFKVFQIYQVMAKRHTNRNFENYFVMEVGSALAVSVKGAWLH